MSWHPPETEAHRPTHTRKAKRQKEKTETECGIMHVDMDAFFASVEQRDQPQLRGKPVIVGGQPGGRGVVAACSYEARKYGVRSGMSTMEAARKCPHAIFVKTHGKKYVHASILILKIFHEYTPVVEPISIDEAFLDISGSIRIFGDEKKLAMALKKEIYEKLQLTCSVGIGPTRIFAKLASGMNKPDGITIFRKADIKEKIHPMPVEKLWGIGEKTAAKLNGLGIDTIGDLANTTKERLKKSLGINGTGLIKAARGESKTIITRADERPDEKSVGNEHTFDCDIGDMDKVFRMLLYLSQKVGRRMRKRNFAGRTVTLKLRYADFETHTHRETFPQLIWDDVGIYNAGKMLLLQLYKPGRKVRLIGVTLSGLRKNESGSADPVHQMDIFSEAETKKSVLPAIDSLRDKFGEKIISRALAKR